METESVKIAILLDQLVMGGVQLIALKEAQELLKRGHAVDVLVLMRERKDPRLSELTRNLEVRFLSDAYPLFFRKSVRIPPFSFLSTGHLLSPYFAHRAIADREYDLIIAHGSTTCLTALSIYRKRNIPYLAFIYDSMNYIFNKVYAKTWLKILKLLIIPIIKIKERSYLQGTLSILTQSQASQEQLAAIYGINAAVITPGCQALSKTPPRRGNYLLASSRWSLNKNPEFLLKILTAIPNAKLKMAGSWESKADLKKYQKLIIQYRLKPRVELITSFTEEEKSCLFQNARVWLHPHFEGFGIGALTAASCGCPIIMPQGSGAAKLFEHGKHGFFPKENDLKAYTKYARLLIENEQLAWEMGKKAWEEVKEKYTWNKHVEKLLQIIGNTAGNTTPT